MVRPREVETLYLVPLRKTPQVIYGYAWRVWAHSTSFYLTPRSALLGGAKISLHGPDSRPGIGSPRFHITVHEGDVAADTGIVNNFSADGRAARFPGRQINGRNAWHVVTMRWSWDLFTDGAPSAPHPGDLKRPDRSAGLVLQAPEETLVTTDVELFVSNGAPYWPDDVAAARRRNALLPPLRNTAGQYLTGVVRQRTSLSPPTPARAHAQAPRTVADRTRGYGLAFDSDGVAWMVEQWMSTTVFGRS